MNDFTGWGFGVQPVRGVRRWRIEDGHLTGVFQNQYEWVSGENNAKCLQGFAPMVSEYFNHRGGHMGHGFEYCTCGFYAYHNGSPYPHKGIGGACGIIEGYGHVVIGEKGFRSEKAKILAISPPPNGIDQFSQIFYPAYLGLFALYYFAMALSTQQLWMAAPGFAFGFLAGIWLWKALVFLVRMRPLKRNYPEAKVYLKYKKMLEDFPLTPVEDLYPGEKEA